MFSIITSIYYFLVQQNHALCIARQFDCAKSDVMSQNSTTVSHHLFYPTSKGITPDSLTMNSIADTPEDRALADVEGGGPWGNAMDVILCLLPIIYLLYATLKRNPTSTTVSLPLAAVMLFMIRLMYLGSDPLLVCASIISGLHEALSPLAIMCGAIFLFDTMEATLCMPFMLREMKTLSKGNPIAETMLLFSFA